MTHMMPCLLCRSQFVYQIDVASFFHPDKYRPIGGSKTVAKSERGHVIWTTGNSVQVLVPYLKRFFCCNDNNWSLSLQEKDG